MPEMTLIKVVTTKKPNKPHPTHLTYKALVGKFFKRVERNYLTIEVTDLCIDQETGKQASIYDVLTSDEVATLAQRFPHLTPKKDLPKMPEPLVLKGTKEEIEEAAKPVEIPTAKEGENKRVELVRYETWEVHELKELLEQNQIKYDKRIKSKDKLIKIIETNNL